MSEIEDFENETAEDVETIDAADEATADAADAPAAEASFASLGLSQTVLDAVADLGYTTPTPVQAQAIPQALAGRDVLAAAQTGTGKTAAFLLPTMDLLPHTRRSSGGRGHRGNAGGGPRMLVITPTRELAQQIDAVCAKIAKRTGHSAVTVVGGVSYNPQRSALRRGCDILVATPGRLEDLVNQGACKLDEVQVLVLDEADRMLDMGFLPSVRRIVNLTPEDRQTLLFSATLDDAQVGEITDLVHDPARVEIAPATSTAETVDQYVLPVSTEAKNGLLAQVLREFGPSHVIVFTRTKRRADTVCRRLIREGISASAIHGDRSQAQRMRALKAFRMGNIDVLVATDVLARGIDISDVRYVVNFDVPEEPVDYIHRIGRTGRAGEAGWSLTFVTEDDVDEFYDIEALMGKTADLFDAEGLDLGAHPPVVDPARVPAKAPAGKKEKKRRRARAEKARAARNDRAPHADRGGRDARGHNMSAGRPAASPSASADPSASKPSRRKRSGRTRVRGAESAVDFDLLTEAEARQVSGHASGDSRSSARGSAAADRKRGGRGGDANASPQGATARSGRTGSRTRGGRSGEEPAYRPSRNARDDWRNYDEPSDRRSRGSRGGRAGGRDNRGSYGARNANGGTGANGSRPTRRPGDRGGRR